MTASEARAEIKKELEMFYKNSRRLTVLFHNMQGLEGWGSYVKSYRDTIRDFEIDSIKLSIQIENISKRV